MLYSRKDPQRGSAIVIALVVAAVVITAGAIGYVLFSKSQGRDVDLGALTHKTITADTSDEIKTLIQNVRNGDYDAKCTYSDDNGDSTLYLSGATKMRIDTTIEDKPGHIIRLDDAGYIWADSQSEGSKLPFTDEKKDSKYSPETFASKVDENNLKCQSVSKLSESLFTLPTDVNFVDVNTRFNSASSN